MKDRRLQRFLTVIGFVFILALFLGPRPAHAEAMLISHVGPDDFCYTCTTGFGVAGDLLGLPEHCDYDIGEGFDECLIYADVTITLNGPEYHYFCTHGGAPCYGQKYQSSGDCWPSWAFWCG